jgi:heme-degrading monooxygenase HmoA
MPAGGVGNGVTMITVISRFKVANGKSEEVDRAFREGPRLVESAPGFRGTSVLRDTNDPSIFYLYTKRESVDCYRTWHSSPAHDASHSGIPKGLKLDASFTQIEILSDHNPESCERTDSFLEAFASESDQLFHFHLEMDGRIRSCSPSFLNVTKLSESEIRGRNIADFLVASDALLLAESLKMCDDTRDFILNFVDSELCPISARARMSVENTGIRLIAERNTLEEDNLGRQLIDLNNGWTQLSRELQQKNHQLAESRDQLAKAIEERDKSYWFIRKINEVLPFCMGCHKVKTTSSTWQDVEEFLKHHTDFLSHGYCPERLEKWTAENL